MGYAIQHAAGIVSQPLPSAWSKLYLLESACCSAFSLPDLYQLQAARRSGQGPDFVMSSPQGRYLRLSDMIRWLRDHRIEHELKTEALADAVVTITKGRISKPATLPDLSGILSGTGVRKSP